MKYIVGLKYTNPSHEHVSLRRRVESRNAVVEASNEEEAILRASRQQRALGFTVREAGIVNSDLNESVQVNESNEEVESVDEAKKQLKPSYWRAEWRLGTQSEVDKNNKKIFDKLAKTDPVKAAAFHDNLMRMKKKDMKEEAVTEAKGEPPAEFMPSDTKLPRIKVPAKPKPGVRKRGPVGSFNKKGFWNPGVRYEEVEQVEEAKVSTVGASKASDSELANYLKKKVKKAQSGGGFKVSKPVKEEEMKPWVKAAQKKFDAETKAQNMGKKQAGTLAAKKERVAQKMIDAAKGTRNKVNMQPSIDMTKAEK